MSLGDLKDLPKACWKELAFILEQKITGQDTFIPSDPALLQLAESLYAAADFHQKKASSKVQAAEQQDVVAVDLNSVQMTESRGIGAELVAREMWDRLELTPILEGCGFSEKELAVAQALILGRLIHPASERATHRWFNEQSALSEMMTYNILGLGKDSYYAIGDRLFESGPAIEQALYNKETTLFSLDRKLFLFDLTNTYLEGSGKGNELACYGVSKEKRRDCPLISLALMVDGQGFPVYSRILKGNQSEPETLKDVLDELKERNPPTLLDTKPTLIMDRGIATRDNLALIKGYGYIDTVIERSPRAKDYVSEFADLKRILVATTPDYSPSAALIAAGWEIVRNDAQVYARSIPTESGIRVLVLSIRRADKENAMLSAREERFLTDLEKLKHSIETGHIKVTAKVMERIGRLKEKYKGFARLYAIQLILSDDEKTAQSLTWTKLEATIEKTIRSGCYVIETDRQGLSAAQIWADDMTITRVESAFRDLKSELGFRPIFHHKKERTEAHLFIGVLAYHLLVAIETTLRATGDTREWKTIREILSTHQRSTIIMTGQDGTIYNLRITGNPERHHHEIYQIFGIIDLLKRRKTSVNERR